MKALPPLFCAAALLFGGCQHAPSPYARQLSTTIKSYKAVDRGDTRANVEARFGPAARTEEEFAVWETRYDEQNFVVLKVRFDAEDVARQIVLTRNRGTQGPGFRASSGVTTSFGSAAKKAK